VKKIQELEAQRDTHLEEIKAHAAKLRGVLEDRDAFLRESRAREEQAFKEKMRDGAQVERIQKAIDRIYGMVPVEVARELGRCESAVREIEGRRYRLEKELRAAKYALEHPPKWPLASTPLVWESRAREEEASKERPRDRAEAERKKYVQELEENRQALEEALAALGTEFEDAQKALAVAQERREEALAALEDEAQAELAALDAPASA
jgi:DNA repair exonuclease SbcCD ATPase subunit